MTPEQSAYDRAYVNRALEASIHIGLAALLAAACLRILLPFIPLIAWGIIIAVAAFPTFKKLQAVLGGHGGLAAALFTLLLLAILILPVLLLARSMVEGVQTLTAHLKSGTGVIPPPPPSVETWPVIGARLKSTWDLASRDVPELVRRFAPQIKAALPGLLSASAGAGVTLLQLLLSILLSGVLLANAHSAYELTCRLANRFFGERGPEFQQLVASTIRSVT
ncbi:MAG TPA: AI-2E family transporter, partial [Terriglobales bacterium]